LHLIVIAEKHQNSGKGKNVMRALDDIARAEKRDISLSSFKCNERAVRLYKSLNYEVTDEEEHFIFFKLSSNNL
jgi:ribosomal protein S18 acetylase RimI-like enzyme